MKLVLISNEEKIFEGEIQEVSVITEEGSLMILPGHEPYMAKISEEVTYKEKDGTKISEEIDDGFVYTDGETCFVVVDKQITSANLLS